MYYGTTWHTLTQVGMRVKISGIVPHKSLSDVARLLFVVKISSPLLESLNKHGKPEPHQLAPTPNAQGGVCLKKLEPISNNTQTNISRTSQSLGARPAITRGRPSPCRFLCIFVVAGECIEEWNGAAGLGRKCKYERCLAKPIFKRNGEAQSLCACPPSRRAQIPAVFRRNYKTAGIAPSMKTVPITRM